ncbi:MAG: hypothetical protein WEE36_00665 [Acidimicrobiia bacterium]
MIEPDGSRLARLVARLPWWLDRVVDSAVAVLGGWTVAYHLALIVGAGRDGAFAFGLGVAAVVIGLMPSANRGGGPEPDPAVDPPRSMALRLGGVAVVAVLAATGSALFWLAAFLFAVWLLGTSSRTVEWRDHRGDHPAGAPWIVVLALGAALLSASVIRWNTDDAYYVNRALVISESSGPMPFGVDTMHSPGTFPSAEPDNDLASWHGLAGLGADLTGMPARGFISLVGQPLVAALAVLAVWRAVGVLGAARPALATTLVFALCLLLAGGSRSVWYLMWASNSGHTTVATVIVPSVLVYAVEAARRPRWGGAIRLAVGCIAGGGASLVAAFVLPPVVGAGVLAARGKPLAREMRVVWIGALVGVAYAVTLAVIGFFSARGLASGSFVIDSVVDQWKVGAIGLLAGPLVVGAVTGLIFLAPVVGSGVGRRFAMFVFVLAFGFVVNPLALAYGGKGSATVFRGAWALVPIVLAAVALDGLMHRIPGWSSVIAVFVVASLMGNPVTELGSIQRPGSDLPGGATTDAARRLIAVAPEGSTVAAALPVLSVVPALTTRVYPLVAQKRFGQSIDSVDSDFRYEDRLAVIRAVDTGRFEGPPERLGELFDQLGIGAVAIGPIAGERNWIVSLLTDLGFEERGKVRGLTIWAR